MSTIKWIALSVFIACAVVAAQVWLRTSNEPAVASSAQGASQASAGWLRAGPPGNSPSGAMGDASATSASQPAGKRVSPLDNVAPPQFQVDAQGQLVLNTQTRDGVEMVASLYDRDEAKARLAEATRSLPAGAQRAVQDLYDRYVQYMQAVRQNFPPEQQAPMSLPQAEEDFARLQKVREAYLGDAAKSLWARDDAVTRKLFDYSGDYLKQHPNATLTEATQAAQDRYAREADGLQGKPGSATTTQP